MIDRIMAERKFQIKMRLCSPLLYITYVSVAFRAVSKRFQRVLAHWFYSPRRLTQSQRAWASFSGIFVNDWCIYDVFVRSIIGRGRETPRMPRGHLWMKGKKAIYNINCLFLHVQTKTFKHGSGIWVFARWYTIVVSVHPKRPKVWVGRD